ncbi:hypothetical protein ACSFA8_15315 [Variovorax sp. RT4R15]|uniref:hypothetical protein n=1 Tax=Variovorax sp. RT4R15 TaxID=3443737 RepID=UPI003F484CEC
MDAQMPTATVAGRSDWFCLESTFRSEAEEIEDDEEQAQYHLARLSIDDLSVLALAWRIRAQRGDKTTAAIAVALTLVADRRRDAAVARLRILAAYRAWPPLRKLAEWAFAPR